MFGILRFLLLWLLQAHSGGLEENRLEFPANDSDRNNESWRRTRRACSKDKTETNMFLSSGDDTVVIEQKG